MLIQFDGKVIKQGNSKMITVPAQFIAEYALNVGDVLQVVIVAKIPKERGKRDEGRKHKDP